MFFFKLKLTRWFFFTLIFAFGAHQVFKLTTKTGKPVLNILTYSSFVSLYGPGRFLKKEFEKNCFCKVQWIVGEDSTGLIQRLALNLKVDLIIGLDQLSLLKTDSSLWQKLSLQTENFISEAEPFLHSPFVPINWAPIGWIYKAELIQPPASLSDIVRGLKKVSFPDPHSSTLGLQFYYWIYSYFKGDKNKIQNFIQKLKPKTYGGSITSWSLAYGFFKTGHASMSLSYLTSPIYHIREEASNQYRFAYFKEGHPWQMEFSGILKKSNKAPLAEAFVRFLLSQKAQSLIMKTHYMFPVIKNVREGVFKNQIIPPLLPYNNIKSFHLQKEELLKLWQKTF